MNLSVPSTDLKRGLVNRVLHNDVDSTFESLQRAIRTVALSFDTLRSEQDSRFREVVKDISLEIKCDRVDLSMQRDRINQHSSTLVTLHTDASELKGRMKALEELRDRDQEAESRNVAQIDLLSEKVVLLETQDLEQILRMKTLNLRCDDLAIERKEEMAKLRTLSLAFEELTTSCIQMKKAYAEENHVLRTQVGSLAQVVNQLATSVTLLSAWKEQATKQHERHENILLQCHRLQGNLTEIIATMSLEQQYLFNINQGMDTKLGLLLEKQGIPTPKIEKPNLDSAAAASFRSVLAELRAIKQAFST